MMIRREVEQLPQRLRRVVRRFFEFDGIVTGKADISAFDEALQVLRERVRVGQMG
jgi:hypothetical protein